MTLSLPSIDILSPREEGGIFLFPSDSTELVKLDLLFEAGSAYQHKKLSASATVKLMTVATETMHSAELAEFMDYRGILIETDSQIQQATLTFYFLRRYADELMPVVRDMLVRPMFHSDDFRVWRERRRQEMLSAEQRPSALARREFYRRLFGEDHPLGAFATPSDLDWLSIEDIRAHHLERYKVANMTVVLAGAVDEELAMLVRETLNVSEHIDARSHTHGGTNVPGTVSHIALEHATQTAIRIGRILPMAWDSEEYARFMLLCTVLGGYFGSRLMQNLREGKGLTYGIYARSQIYRDSVVFYITADVSGGMAERAVGEVSKELSRLCAELVPETELQRVKAVMVGDFLRSIDGVFERSARFCDMYATCVTEQLTANLNHALSSATPDGLRTLASRYMQPSSMTVCTAGVY